MKRKDDNDDPKMNLNYSKGIKLRNYWCNPIAKIIQNLPKTSFKKNKGYKY